LQLGADALCLTLFAFVHCSRGCCLVAGNCGLGDTRGQAGRLILAVREDFSRDNIPIGSWLNRNSSVTLTIKIFPFVTVAEMTLKGTAESGALMSELQLSPYLTGGGDVGRPRPRSAV